MDSNFSVPKAATGLVLGALLWIIIIGGISRIASVASKIIPIMGIVYFGGALIIGAPTVFLLLVFTSALMKTNGKMGGYKEYEVYGKSSLNDCPPFILPDPTIVKNK